MIQFSGIETSSVRVHGFSPWSSERIAAEFGTGIQHEEIPGDCVISASGTDAIGSYRLLLSTALCCHNYYWVPSDSRFVHGPGFFDVLRQSGLQWKWNSRSIACLLTSEFTISTDTLHPSIERFPPAAVLIHRNGRSTLSISQYWDTIFHGKRTTAQDTLDVLRMIMEEVKNPAALSLSAGFDSRVLLALLVEQGKKPVIGTMGYATSTDMQVASAIAQHFGLEHRQVVLEPHDYLKYARQITRITGGTKTADHWHTYIYIHNVGFSQDSVHWAGSNGEFARTTWYDWNPRARLFDRTPCSIARRIIARRFTHGPYTRRYEQANQLMPDSCDSFRVTDVPLYFSSHLSKTVGRLNQLDQFIALHPTRHFIGNGVTLYRSLVPTHSPFLDVRWISKAARLPRQLRVGSNFHRFAVCSLLPQLRSFPIGIENTMRETAPWNNRNPKGKPTPYSSFSSVAALPECQEVLHTSRHLAELFDSERLMRALTHDALIPVLLSLHFAGEAARDAVHSC